jgi:hypothetical protein
MILRRVMQHVRDQNWFAVGIDFVIVVVGVFIGIQVANWNEALAEKRRLGHQLVSLHAEFTENLGRFDAYQQRLEGQIADITVLRRVVAGEATGASSSDVDRMLMNAFGVAVFTVDRTTLDELKQNGSLRNLQSMGLRRPLIEWAEAHAGLRRLEADNLALRNAAFAPFTMDELALGAMGEHYAAVRDFIAPAPFRNDITLLQGNRKLDNNLVLKLGPTAACLEFLARLRGQTQAVLERLEAEGFSQ